MSTDNWGQRHNGSASTLGYMRNNNWYYCSPPLVTSYLTSLLVQLAFGGALGHALCPLQPFLWSVTQKQVECLKVEPRQVFWKLQLSTGDVPPHGPAQDRKAAFPSLDIDCHLPEVMQAELGGGSHLKMDHTLGHFTH